MGEREEAFLEKGGAPTLSPLLPKTPSAPLSKTFVFIEPIIRIWVDDRKAFPVLGKAFLS